MSVVAADTLVQDNRFAEKKLDSVVWCGKRSTLETAHDNMIFLTSIVTNEDAVFWFG